MEIQAFWDAVLRQDAEGMRAFFWPDALYFPARDILFYQSDVRGMALTGERMKVYRALMEEDLDAAIREMMFHPYIRRMGELRRAFEGKKLETVLFQIRDHVSSDDLKVILRTLDGLEQWLREE